MLQLILWCHIWECKLHISVNFPCHVLVISLYVFFMIHMFTRKGSYLSEQWACSQQVTTPATPLTPRETWLVWPKWRSKVSWFQSVHQCAYKLLLWLSRRLNSHFSLLHHTLAKNEFNTTVSALLHPIFPLFLTPCEDLSQHRTQKVCFLSNPLKQVHNLTPLSICWNLQNFQPLLVHLLLDSE